MRASSNILIVMLRQPRKSNPSEMRSDPFWEFGSFGCTGCHRRNLLNPKRAKELEGMRLAFAQGGPEEIKLVHLTPPISVIRHSIGCEFKWSPRAMPLRYSMAPIIISNNGKSDMPTISSDISGVARSTRLGKFASKFRSRREPLGLELARQLEIAYKKYRRRNGAIAKHYKDALPFPPPKVDRRRDQTYRRLVAQLEQFPARCSSSTERTRKRASRC